MVAGGLRRPGRDGFGALVFTHLEGAPMAIDTTSPRTSRSAAGHRRRDRIGGQPVLGDPQSASISGVWKRNTAAIATAILIAACGAGGVLPSTPTSAAPTSPLLPAASPSAVPGVFGTDMSSLGPSAAAALGTSPPAGSSLVPEASASHSATASATTGSTTIEQLTLDLVDPADLAGSVTGVPAGDPILCPGHGNYVAGTGERAAAEVYQTNAPAADIVEDVYLFPDIAPAGSYNSEVMAAARACGSTATLKTAFLSVNYTLNYEATTIGTWTGLRVNAQGSGTDHGKSVSEATDTYLLQDAAAVLQLQYTADAPLDQAMVDALLTGLVDRVGV